MATTTTNLGLTKPDAQDAYNIADHNGNMDILDEAIHDTEASTVTFTEADSYADLESGDTHAALFGKIKKFFSNITTKITTAEGKIADTKDSKVTFTTASSDANINSGEKHSVMFGKIKKFISTVTSSLSSINTSISNHASSLSTLQTNMDKRNLKTYYDLSQFGASTANTLPQVISLMPVNSMLEYEVPMQSSNLHDSIKTYAESLGKTFYFHVVKNSSTSALIEINSESVFATGNYEYKFYGMWNGYNNKIALERAISSKELTPIGRKYVLLGAANSSTGSSDVKVITLNDDFTKYNELMFVMDINGTQYNPTKIPVERFYNASTIAISHTDDGGTIWAKAISYSNTSVGYSASSNIVTLAIYGVI